MPATKAMPDVSKQTLAHFKKAVNMTAAQIEKHIKTDEIKEVGQDSGVGTSIGVHSAHKILAIKKKKAGELTEADYTHMKKVISYVARHSAQGPDPGHDREHSRWRYSLMNRGHDPMRK